MHLTRRDQKGSQGTMRFSLQLDNAQARVSMEECWPNICEALGAINPAPPTPSAPNHPHTTKHIFEMAVLRFRRVKSHMDVV